MVDVSFSRYPEYRKHTWKDLVSEEPMRYLNCVKLPNQEITRIAAIKALLDKTALHTTIQNHTELSYEES